MDCDICKKSYQELYNCSACQTGLYCSVECQAVDYPNHRLICGRDPNVVVTEIINLAEQCNTDIIEEDLDDKTPRELAQLLRRGRRKLKKLNTMRRRAKRYLARLDADSGENIQVLYSLEFSAVKRYAAQLKQSVVKKRRIEGDST